MASSSTLEVDPLSDTPPVPKSNMSFLPDKFDHNSEKMISRLEKLSTISPALWTEKDLELIKKLQQSGLPNFVPQRNRYSTAPKVLPEILCSCPQKCDDKVPLKIRTYMFKYYQSLKDRSKQEELLLRYIEMKSLHRRVQEDNKRVQCRYKAPVTREAIQFIFENSSFQMSDDEDEGSAEKDPLAPDTKKRKLNSAVAVNGRRRNGASDSATPSPIQTLTSDPNVKYRVDFDGLTEVCQKAFMNVFLVPEKRVRAVREKLVASKRLLMEKELAESQELETTVMIARDLAAGCKPLLAMFNSQHANGGGRARRRVGGGGDDENLPLNSQKHDDINSQLLSAIDSDIELVNNFFYNQLWKPEFLDKLDDEDMKLFNKNLAKNIESLSKTPVSVNTTVNSLNDTIDSVVNESLSTKTKTLLTDESATIDDSSRFESSSMVDGESLQNDSSCFVDVSKSNSSTDGEEEGRAASEENKEVADGGSDGHCVVDPSPALSVPNDEQSSALNLSTTSKTVPAMPALKAINGAQNLSLSNNTSTENGSHVPKSGSFSNSAYHNGVSTKTSSQSSSSGSKTNRHLPRASNILANSSTANVMSPPPPSLLSASSPFDNDLKKYLSGLESSISITPKSNGSRGNFTAASITAQLIQNALSNQTSISVTAARSKNSSTRGGAGDSSVSMGSASSPFYHSSSLNQILNIPDSVSITPTLVDNSKS